MDVPIESRGPTKPGPADRTRTQLERVGADTWDLCLRFLTEIALQRPIGPESVSQMRQLVFGPTDRPGSAPTAPSPLTDVMREVEERIMPALFSSWHPRSFSYFTPPPMIASIVGDVIAAWANQSADTWQSAPGAALIEQEVVAWLAELCGYPPGSSGVLTSGGVMANLTALAVMRDVHLPRILGDDAVHTDLARARVYTSDQTHFSVARSLALLGFPPTTLVVLPSDARFRLPVELVDRAIERDRASGLVPLGIAAVAGSTNTGSIDPIGELADLADRHSVWLHVDAAYGGGALCSPSLRSMLGPVARAHSITIDPHKWMFQTIDIGGIVFRDGEVLLETFDREPEYYATNQREARPVEWFRHGIEGTRRFRALKLWMSWREVGTAGFGDMVDRTTATAAQLAGLVRDAEDLELAVEPELSVVCFRHQPPGLVDRALDAHQVRLQRALEVSGDAWVSTTTLRGATWLRAGVMHPDTSTEDLIVTLDAVRRAAASSSSEEGLALPRPP